MSDNVFGTSWFWPLPGVVISNVLLSIARPQFKLPNLLKSNWWNWFISDFLLLNQYSDNLPLKSTYKYYVRWVRIIFPSRQHYCEVIGQDILKNSQLVIWALKLHLWFAKNAFKCLLNEHLKNLSNLKTWNIFSTCII